VPTAAIAIRWSAAVADLAARPRVPSTRRAASAAADSPDREATATATAHVAVSAVEVSTAADVANALLILNRERGIRFSLCRKRFVYVRTNDTALLGVNKEYECFQSVDAQLSLMRSTESVLGPPIATVCTRAFHSRGRKEDAARTLGAVLSHNKVWQRHSDRWCLVAVPAGNLSEKNALGQQAQ